MKRSLLVEGHGISLGRVLAPANWHGSPLLAPTPNKLDGIGLADTIIIVRRLIRGAWTLYRWDDRPARRP